MTVDRPFSILVTDDDPASRETFREIFEPVGFRTFLAESGEEAIEIIHRHDVHVALMDMHLPRLSGLETMAIVREIKGMLPMILISADQDESLMRRALSAQAFSVLAKPVSRSLVIYIVRRALEKFYWALDDAQDSHLGPDGLRVDHPEPRPRHPRRPS